MFSVNMTTRECDGRVVVVLCGELDEAAGHARRTAAAMAGRAALAVVT
jgi:hypothetical protein